MLSNVTVGSSFVHCRHTLQVCRQGYNMLNLLIARKNLNLGPELIRNCQRGQKISWWLHALLCSDSSSISLSFRLSGTSCTWITTSTWSQWRPWPPRSENLIGEAQSHLMRWKLWDLKSKLWYIILVLTRLIPYLWMIWGVTDHPWTLLNRRYGISECRKSVKEWSLSMSARTYVYIID